MWNLSSLFAGSAAVATSTKTREITHWSRLLIVGSETTLAPGLSRSLNFLRRNLAVVPDTPDSQNLQSGKRQTIRIDVTRA